MRKVRCPHCGKETVFSPENPYRPFCCERCKMIDLGDWADERYKVPANQQEEESPAISQESYLDPEET